MADWHNKIAEAAAAVRKTTSHEAAIGIVTGTGLGALSSEVSESSRISFSDIPHMASAGVQSHAGDCVAGSIEGVNVFVLEGRLHGYEGHSLEDIVFPVRLLHGLGCSTLILSNAAGGLNPGYQLGDIVAIDDHINLPGLVGHNPLVGPNDDSVGPRFPDMSAPYDAGLLKTAEESADELGLRLHRGVYVMVTGPNLETRAEYRMLRNLGADVVGMSTLPEVVAARHLGMKVVAFSIVTDMCLPDELEEANIERIIATASAAEPKLTSLVKSIVKTIG